MVGEAESLQRLIGALATRGERRLADGTGAVMPPVRAERSAEGIATMRIEDLTSRH